MLENWVLGAVEGGGEVRSVRERGTYLGENAAGSTSGGTREQSETRGHFLWRKRNTEMGAVARTKREWHEDEEERGKSVTCKWRDA